MAASSPSPRTLRILTLAVLALAAHDGVGAVAAQEDLDEFMEKVLRRRRTNWAEMYRYTVRDREAVEVKGPGGVVMESYRGEYTWYVREGFLIRSPDEVNGARVDDEERERYEQKWLEDLQREQARRERRARRSRRTNEGDDEGGESLEREYFLGFRFEPGNYYVAGREQFEGRDVVRIEYFPERLWTDDEEPDEDEERVEDGGADIEDEERDVEDELGDDFGRKFQKTTLVTMWVLPEEHQIVKISFANVGLEYLPFRWLVQIDDVEASMVMHQPFDEDVWLPREIRAYGRATVATGSFEVLYSLDYFDYREAETSAKVRFRLPDQEQQQQRERPQPEQEQPEQQQERPR